jgi:hypothetical protein
VLAGTNLEQAILSPEATALAAAATENETSSDMDNADIVEPYEESSLASRQHQR